MQLRFTCLLASLWLLSLISGCRVVTYNEQTAKDYWDLPYDNGHISYQGEVMSRKTMAENYNQLKAYLVRNYPDSLARILTDNDSNLIVFGNAFDLVRNRGSFTSRQLVEVFHKVTFEITDSSVKYKLTDLHVRYLDPGFSIAVGTPTIGAQPIPLVRPKVVREPFEQWLASRSGNKKTFLDTKFKPRIARFAASLAEGMRGF